MRKQIDNILTYVGEKITTHIYIYVIIRGNVTYECFRVLDYLCAKHKYKA